MTLEMEAIETSLAKLAPSGWEPGVAYVASADSELMEEDRVEKGKRQDRERKSGIFSCKSVFIFPPTPPVMHAQHNSW